MKRLIIDRVPIYVALITLLGTAGSVAYNAVHDAARDPCAVAREWIVAGAPNPALTDADKVKLSTALVARALECAR